MLGYHEPPQADAAYRPEQVSRATSLLEVGIPQPSAPALLLAVGARTRPATEPCCRHRGRTSPSLLHAKEE